MRPFVEKETKQAANDFLLYEGDRAVEVVKAGPEAADARDRLALQTARQLYQRHRFFHWDLEFPEVFIDLERADWKDNPGFDAVVGNPPYVRQEQLRLFKPFFKEAYAKVYAGTADLFVYFFGRALALLKEGGRTSYISSNSWLRANYATNLRAYLRQEMTIEALIDLGDNRVFEDAPDLYPSIHVVEKEKPTGKHQTRVAIFDRNEGISELETQLQKMLFEVSLYNQEDSGWQLEGDSAAAYEECLYS
jgi:methylase of polypeptide subunit release factors